MLNAPTPHDGELRDSYERLASWQGEMSSDQEVHRQAALLINLYGRSQAFNEAVMRASAARDYSSLLSADFWDRVSKVIGQELDGNSPATLDAVFEASIPCNWKFIP